MILVTLTLSNTMSKYKSFEYNVKLLASIKIWVILQVGDINVCTLCFESIYKRILVDCRHFKQAICMYFVFLVSINPFLHFFTKVL